MFPRLNWFSGFSERYSGSHSLFSLRGRILLAAWIVLQGVLMGLVAPVVLGAVELPLQGPSGEAMLGLGTLWGVAYSPNGRYIATCGGLGAFLWDAETGELVRWFSGYLYGGGSVAFSPDGNRLLTGSSDGTVKLWDVETGAGIRRFSQTQRLMFSPAFSPDGRRVLTGTWDSTTKLWNVETAAEIRTFRHTRDVKSVAFSPDGRRVLTGSRDDTAKLWDVETGAEIRTFRHTRDVKSVAAIQDGKTRTAKMREFNHNFSNSMGFTPLMVATYLHNVDSIQLLLEEDADINAKSNYGDTVLMIAAQEGYADLVGVFITNSANVNARDQFGDTALLRAVIRGNTKVVQMLLENGADPNVKNNNGWSARTLASFRKNDEIVKILSRAGANGKNIEEAKMIKISTLTMLLKPPREDVLLAMELHLAVEDNRLEDIKKLISRGTTPNLVARHVGVYDNSGWPIDNTPLKHAFLDGYYEACRLLLDAGARIPTVYGKPLIFSAARSEETEMLKLFVDAGADVNQTDKSPSPKTGKLPHLPIELAVLGDSPLVLKILLDAGARVDHPEILRLGRPPTISSPRNGLLWLAGNKRPEMQFLLRCTR